MDFEKGLGVQLQQSKVRVETKRFSMYFTCMRYHAVATLPRALSIMSVVKPKPTKPNILMLQVPRFLSMLLSKFDEVQDLSLALTFKVS